VTKKLWKVFALMGVPKILQSDNGSEFVNQAVESLKKLYGIEERLSTPYHPRANGLVERKNKEVERTLEEVKAEFSRFCTSTT